MVEAAMIRSAAAGLLGLALAGPAVAGDFAERRIIGFSQGGERFAFEEFGVQAGSGFPYSNIFVIDTATDGWVAGTPLRIQVKEDSGKNPYEGKTRAPLTESEATRMRRKKRVRRKVYGST